MTTARVALFGRTNASVVIRDTEATAGAVFGVNLVWPDGSLVTQEDFVGGGEAQSPSDTIVYWRTIQEVPPNVQQVAGLSVSGFVRRGSDGSWTAAPITNPDLSGASTSGLAEGSNLYFTPERAQDAVGAAIAAGTGDGVTLTYDDAGNAIGATNTDKGSVAVASHVAAPDPHPQYLTQAEGDARYALSGAGLVLTASGAISALRMIVAEGGSGRYPDTSVAADAGRVVGMSTTSAASGDPFDVLTNGEHVDAGWSWSPGPVFCGVSGVLTQSPGTGWVLEVGRALSATRLLVDVKTPLIRS